MAGCRTALVAVFCALALGACSSLTLTDAATLSRAGQAASLQMEQNASVSAETLTALKRAVAFNDGFNNAVGNPDSQKFVADEAIIQTNLARYAKALTSLSSAYAALGDLAGYDASGSFNTAMDKLAADTQSFIAGIDPAIKVPAVVPVAARSFGGIVISSMQADAIVDASAQIEQQLKTLIDVLKERDTRKLLVLNSAMVQGQLTQAAAEGFASGAYSYAPLLDSLGAPLNLKSTAKADELVPKNEKLLAGLRNVVITEAGGPADALGASYDKSLAALDALVPLHESLQNGAPLNLATLTAIVGKLQSIATALQPGKGK